MTEHTHIRVRKVTKDRLKLSAMLAEMNLIEYMDFLSYQLQPTAPKRPKKESND